MENEHSFNFKRFAPQKSGKSYFVRLFIYVILVVGIVVYVTYLKNKKQKTKMQVPSEIVLKNLDLEVQ
jgi:hypothetical protein